MVACLVCRLDKTDVTVSVLPWMLEYCVVDGEAFGVFVVGQRDWWLIRCVCMVWWCNGYYVGLVV